MRTALVLLVLLAVALSPAPLFAKGGGKKDDGGKKEAPEKDPEKDKDKDKDKDEEKKDEKKEFLVSIGKSLKGEDADAIAKHFRSKGKVELKLSGVKDGKYRPKQALNVLKEYFKSIEPTECELKDHKGTYGKYKLKYKKLGKTIEATVKVHLEKEGTTWRITGIEES